MSRMPGIFRAAARAAACLLLMQAGGSIVTGDEPNTTAPAGRVFSGADEKTPSRSQYFSWVNNTNEGSTEAQTLTNLAFFRWLREEYGMVLDIYAFDAGNFDGPRNGYGRCRTPATSGSTASRRRTATTPTTCPSRPRWSAGPSRRSCWR